MKQVADYVNEKKRDAENMNSVFAVQEKLIFPPGISQVIYSDLTFFFQSFFKPN